MILAPRRLFPLPAASRLRWVLALGAALLACLAQLPSGPRILADEWLRDRFLRAAVSTAPEPRILVVDIDEASLRNTGPWPWPRARLADLVEILLTDYAARGVALDIMLPKAADEEGDLRLGLLASHAPVVLAQAFDYSDYRPEPLRAGALAGALPGNSGPALPATGYIGNHAALAAQARHAGNIGFVPDPDGALRRLPLLTSFEGRTYPALALALLRASGGAPAPGTDSAALRVDFRRDWNAYTVVSAADILDRSLSPQGASGRLVLIGSSSVSLGDRVTTPLAASRPGLGVQAAMLSTLLDRQAGTTPARWPGRWIAALYALALAGLALYTLPRLSAARSVALLGGASVVWLAIARALVPHDPDFSPCGPLATALFLLAFAVPYQWQLTQDRSRQLLDTLRQYVAPVVVEQLMRSDLADPLRPRQGDVTTLVADMEGYTSQVEALSVEEAALLTRQFLECLTGPVIGHEGTLDKYTGDGLVAFWGAPLPHPAHADRALDAAAEILRRVATLSAQRQARGFPALRVRIGIESGPAMAGDFGTTFRSIYTAVGDSVNTAARLEQAARDFPHDVIVGPGTASRAMRHRLQPLGERLLRGKEKPTMLFTFDLA